MDDAQRKAVAQAMIQRAIDDIFLSKEDARHIIDHLRLEAAEWVQSDESEEVTGSFRWACAQAGVQPWDVRRRLMYHIRKIGRKK